MTQTNEHCNAAETLQGAGLSQTTQRMAVLEIIIKADGPLSAADILNRTDPKQKINKVTIYRILSSFKERRIIRELPTDQGMNLYEMACRHNPIHPHFYCKTCRIMSCLPPLTLSQAMDWFAGSNAFRIDDVHVNLSGVCRRCRE
ncbi:MAG: transcriptional repressor [Syntrophales bacterium]|nr:transcriptional repressor [Syntrophales bacterium]